MAAEYLAGEEHQVVERRWPRNSILDTANSHLGKPWEDRYLLKLRMLSRYTKQKVRCWKILPALQSPIGIHRNLYIPKGVMMEVFWMSSRATGTW